MVDNGEEFGEYSENMGGFLNGAPSHHGFQH